MATSCTAEGSSSTPENGDDRHLGLVVPPDVDCSWGGDAGPDPVHLASGGPQYVSTSRGGASWHTTLGFADLMRDDEIPTDPNTVMQEAAEDSRLPMDS